MYNVLDIERAADFIGVCEGELDTLTLSACVGIPCIGVPGAKLMEETLHKITRGL